MSERSETFEYGSVFSPSDNMRKLQDLRDAAFNELAFWSNPAWMDSNSCSMSATAVTQWVVHHRTWMAVRNITIAQIIGGVRGVIPQSRLARYGDFRYDIDHEDIYLTNNESYADCESAAVDVNEVTYKDYACSSKNINIRTDTFAKYDQLSSPYTERNGKTFTQKNTSLMVWLKKVKDLLTAVRRITDQNILVDSKTDALMKICFRFLHAARINQDLIRHINSEIYFITDYDELLKERVGKIELHSIPQPCATVEADLSGEMVDVYWAKLSSPGIRRLWKRNIYSECQHNLDHAFLNESLPLVWINFLRRHELRIDSQIKNVDIPKNVAEDLLGSLLQSMDEMWDIPIPEPTMPRTFSIPKNSFPQAHGEWTKNLFPNSLESIPLPDKEAIVLQNNRNAQIPSRAQMKYAVPGSQYLSLPMRFCMTVPPPPLASPVRMPKITPSHIYCQAQNAMTVLTPRNSLVHQQVPFCTQVPVLPSTYIPPPTYMATQALPINWNYMTQRQSAPFPTAVSCNSIKLNGSSVSYYQHSSNEIPYVQNNRMNTEATDGSSTCNQSHIQDLQKNELENMHFHTENFYPVTKTIVQTPNLSEFTVPIKAIPSNTQNIARNCNIFQPVKYASSTMANIHCMKPNHQLQKPLPHQTRTFMSYKLLDSGLRTPISPMIQVNSQLSLQPKFMVPVIEKDGKMQQDPVLRNHRVGSNFVYKDNHNSTSIENLLLNRQESSLHYAEKVNKWLETVDPYMIPGSNSFTEKLSDESGHFEPLQSKKLGNFNLTKCSSSVFKNSQSECKHAFFQKPKEKMANRTLKENNKNFMNNSDRKMNVKKSVERLNEIKTLFLSSLVKLKRSKDPNEKLELLRRSLEEVSLSKSRKTFFKRHKSKNLPIRHFRRNKCAISMTKFKKFSNKLSPGLERKFHNCDFSAEAVFNKTERTCLSTNSYNFRILTRESFEFNSFPSKRLKLSSISTTYFDEDFETHNQLNKAVSDMDYYKMMVDNLFFSDQNDDFCIDSNAKNDNSCLIVQKINGWTHFKITMNTILNNVSSLLGKIK